MRYAFRRSHAECIGAGLDGLAPGIEIDTGFISERLSKRRPDGVYSTKRSEKDEFRIVSGVFEGKTTGTPLTFIIPNEDTRSRDYIKGDFRPGHADYPANEKYHGFEDYRGGGHFSGRITAALVAAGTVCELALMKKNIYIGTHILACAGITTEALKTYGRYRTTDKRFSLFLR